MPLVVGGSTVDLRGRGCLEESIQYVADDDKCVRRVEQKGGRGDIHEIVVSRHRHHQVWCFNGLTGEEPGHS